MRPRHGVSNNGLPQLRKLRIDSHQRRSKDVALYTSVKNRSLMNRPRSIQHRLHQNMGMMDMFKHLLLPTDGSELSQAAIHAGVQFAKSIGAKITGFYAMPKFHMLTYQTEMLTDTKDQFANDCKAHAERFLAVVAQAAKAADVPCETALQTS